MNEDDLKRYTVKVHNGSGCLFQPMNKDEYTYILTAKHIFFSDQKDGRTVDLFEIFSEDQEVGIWQNIKIPNGWSEEKIVFKYKKDENIFFHNDADAAILIIPNLKGFDLITKCEDQGVNFLLSGFPGKWNVEDSGIKQSNLIIERIRSNSGNFFNYAEINKSFSKDQIEGMSGGPIMRIKEQFLELCGIQSRTANLTTPLGQIGYIPMKYFDEIINKHKLNDLLPIFLKSFEYLKDSIFISNISVLDLPIFEIIIIQIKNFGSEIFNSDISPQKIFADFKEQILISDKDQGSLSNKKLWLGFLEYLLIAKITLDYPIAYSEIENLCNKIRFKFSNSEKEWTNLLDTEIANSNYKGLKSGSKVILQTEIPSSNRKIIKANKFPSIISRVDKSKLQIDRGITNPFSDFDFIHCEYFLDKCILENLINFSLEDTPNDIITKLLPLFKEILES